MLFDVAQKVPVAGAGVFLFDRAAVYGDRRYAPREGPVQNSKEAIAALIRVVDPAPHLERHRDVIWHCFEDAADDFEGFLGLAEMVSAAASADGRLDRAAEVNV